MSEWMNRPRICPNPAASALVSASPHTLASYSAWLGIVQAHLWLERPCAVPDVLSQSGLSPLFCGLENVQSPCGLSRSGGGEGKELVSDSAGSSFGRRFQEQQACPRGRQ